MIPGLGKFGTLRMWSLRWSDVIADAVFHDRSRNGIEQRFVSLFFYEPVFELVVSQSFELVVGQTGCRPVIQTGQTDLPEL
jgi:hypothetical protein